MAVRYAVANGNWSNTATWDGGTLPTSADDVYANNKTVTIDQNVTVISINNTASSPAVAGGGFTVSTNNLTITANLNYGPTGFFTASQTGLLTILGSFTGTPTAGSITGTTFNSTGTINITGNVTAISATSNNTINNIGGGTINITGNIIGGGSTTSVGVNLTNASILNVTGNVTGGIGGSANGIQTANTSKVTINGTITGGSGGNGINISSTSSTALTLTGACISGGNSAITNASTGTVTINTTQTAAGTASVYMITNSSSGIININGDCLGALSSAPSNALILNNSSTGTVNISGSVTARSVSPSTTNGIVNNTSTGTINVGGSVSGGSVANTIGMGNGSSGTINVTGNITGGSNATNTPAIYSTTAGTIDVTGSATAGLYPALFSTSVTATNILRGNITNALGVPAFFTFKTTISPSAVQTHTIQDTGNIDRLFSTSNVSVGAPAVTNVRAGVVYGSLNELTGTMIVPTPANVRNGVPTDNTVGTADLTISEFWDYDVTLLNQPNSIGARLKNCSTIESTGAQLAAF